MSKGIHRGFAKADDPMFTEGFSTSSVQRSKGSDGTSQSGTDGEPPAPSPGSEEEQLLRNLEIQDKIDQYLIDIGAVRPQNTEQPEKGQSVTMNEQDKPQDDKPQEQRSQSQDSEETLEEDETDEEYARARHKRMTRGQE